MIVVKETGSPYFDCAYFVLRCDLPESPKDSDILREANRMIESCIPKVECSETEAHKTNKEATIKRSAIVPIALLCAVIPTAAVIGVCCLIF